MIQFDTALYSIFGSMPAPRFQKCHTLYHLARTCPVHCAAIDLGTWHGYSAIAMALGSLENTHQVTVHTIDDFTPKKGWAGEPYGPDDLDTFLANQQNAREITRSELPLHLVIGNSRDVAASTTLSVGLWHWDLGCDNVLGQDLAAWYSHIIDGGVIVVHDTLDGRFGAGELLRSYIKIKGCSGYRILPGGLHMVHKKRHPQ